MQTAFTQALIKERGWTYHPESDILTGKDKMVSSTSPECWTHETHETQWNIDEVLSIIQDEIELEIERDLD